MQAAVCTHCDGNIIVNSNVVAVNILSRIQYARHKGSLRADGEWAKSTARYITATTVIRYHHL